MKYYINLLAGVLALSIFVISCNDKASTEKPGSSVTSDTIESYDTNFTVEAESFADLQVLRYQVPGFKQLSLQQKQLAYYLYEAALCGRDIAYDQRGKYELLILRTLNSAYGTYNGDKNSEDWKKYASSCLFVRMFFNGGKRKRLYTITKGKRGECCCIFKTSSTHCIRSEV